MKLKATFVLPNGTKVEIDGQPDEVRRLFAAYGLAPGAQVASSVEAPLQSIRNTAPSERTLSELDVVNKLKEDETLHWAHTIVDSRDVTLRVLLPLYIAAEIDPSGEGLTSGFIERVYAQMGVRLFQANIARELAGKAKRYVLADTVRRKGAPVRYKISRAGRLHIEQSRSA